ncbi:phosphatase PAP2 family protein [Streptomyces ovatisporus]|uniref:Phosphatase PAP2 family protein n=1 Tax=Streptomyces ovatisporus TaxID=1128682 RepID=A0ABV9A887_9ACTN
MRPLHVPSASGPSASGSGPSGSAPSRGPWLCAALGLTGASATLVVLVALAWQPLLDVDEGVADWMHARALAHPALTEANRVLTDWVWDPVTMRLLIAAAALWLWLRRGETLLAVWCVATSAVGTGVQQSLKAVLDRERPQWEHPVDSAHYAAMPSGHAMTAAVTCTLVVWLVREFGAPAPAQRIVPVLGLVSVLGVCLTRIVLGVHWPTDTLVGAMLGVALAAAAIGAWYTLLQRFTWKPHGHNEAAPAARDASG